MRRGSLAALVTLLFAAAAAAGGFMYVQNARRNAQAVEQTVRVLVAKTDIPAGVDLDPLLNSGEFVYRDIPRDALIKGVVTVPYQLQGQRTAYPILAGEQISPARFVGDMQAAGGRYGLKTGYQAFALTLDPQRAAGGVLQKGDAVEAYGTFTDPGTQKQMTKVIVQHAEVLDSVRNANTGSGVTVLLEVTGQQAEWLTYTQEQGHVWLTLLAPNEPGVHPPVLTSKEVQ